MRAISPVLLSALLLACGTEVRVEGDPVGQGGAGGEATTTGTPTPGAGGSINAQPPPPPLDGMPTGPGEQFVMQRLWVGDADRSGTPSPNAWHGFGYDIDGQDGASGPHCQAYGGADPSNAFTDGDAGRDNAFGRTWLPILRGLVADFGAQVNERLQQGEGNLLFDLLRVGSGDHLGSEGRIYLGSPTTFAPTFAGADLWLVTAASLESPPDLSSARFSTIGYVSQSVWVSGPGPLEIPLVLGGAELPLPLSTAVVTIDLTNGRGVIAGVIDVDLFVQVFRQFAGALDPALCSGATLEAVEDEFRKGSDIMSDGTQDPNRTCDGVSVGMEFDVVNVQISGAASPVPTPVPPCP